MSERPYTTIAVSKSTYKTLLGIRHIMEKKTGKSISYNDVLRNLCSLYNGGD